MERLPFYSPELNRQGYKFDLEAAKAALEVLRSDALRSEILQGNVTLAMIRPNVGPEANSLNLPDQEAADTIEEMIGGLGMMAKFSVRFSPEAVNDFYGGGPEASMLKEMPQNPEAYDSRWPEFIDFMTSAPTTVLLLHSPDHDAIEKWRDHLGHWNIDEFRDPSTIRGRLGVNKYNNLVHGSDAPESALREVDIIARQLERAIDAAIAKDHVERQLAAFRGDRPEHEWLADAGVLDDPQQPYDIIPHNDWRRLGGESYVMDFTVVTDAYEKHLIAKACVKIPPKEVMHEWLGRRELLASSGISTPELYAVQGATVLEEFIPYSLGEAYRSADAETRETLRARFFEIYSKLDELGFKPINLHDLRSRGDDVVVIDFGEDLGGVFGPPSTKNLEARSQETFKDLIKEE